MKKGAQFGSGYVSELSNKAHNLSSNRVVDSKNQEYLLITGKLDFAQLPENTNFVSLSRSRGREALYFNLSRNDNLQHYLNEFKKEIPKNWTKKELFKHMLRASKKFLGNSSEDKFDTFLNQHLSLAEEAIIISDNYSIPLLPLNNFIGEGAEAVCRHHALFNAICLGQIAEHQKEKFPDVSVRYFRDTVDTRRCGLIKITSPDLLISPKFTSLKPLLKENQSAIVLMGEQFFYADSEKKTLTPLDPTPSKQSLYKQLGEHCTETYTEANEALLDLINSITDKELGDYGGHTWTIWIDEEDLYVVDSYMEKIWNLMDFNDYQEACGPKGYGKKAIHHILERSGRNAPNPPSPLSAEILQENLIQELEIQGESSKPSMENIKKLISQGASLETLSSSGWTTVHIAALCKDTHFIKMNTFSNHFLNRLNARGNTAFHCAIQLDSSPTVQSLKEIITTLVEKGADPNLPDSKGESAWQKLKQLYEEKKELFISKSNRLATEQIFRIFLNHELKQASPSRDRIHEYFTLIYSTNSFITAYLTTSPYYELAKWILKNNDMMLWEKLRSYDKSFSQKHPDLFASLEKMLNKPPLTVNHKALLLEELNKNPPSSELILLHWKNLCDTPWKVGRSLLLTLEWKLATWALNNNNNEILLQLKEKGYQFNRKKETLLFRVKNETALKILLEAQANPDFLEDNTSAFDHLIKQNQDYAYIFLQHELAKEQRDLKKIETYFFTLSGYIENSTTVNTWLTRFNRLKEIYSSHQEAFKGSEIEKKYLQFTRYHKVYSQIIQDNLKPKEFNALNTAVALLQNNEDLIKELAHPTFRAILINSPKKKLTSLEITDLVMIKQFCNEKKLAKARYGSSIDLFYKDALTIRLSNAPLQEQAKRIRESAYKHFKHKDKNLRLLADALMLLGFLFGGGFVALGRKITGRTFFFSNANTKRTTDLESLLEPENKDRLFRLP